MDRFVNTDAGDLAVDTDGQRPNFHPHMTAPLLKARLSEIGVDCGDFTTIIVVRNPIDMLWSYYKFFQPDVNGLYNYDLGHDPSKLAGFDRWIHEGRVGLIEGSEQYMPSNVTDMDLTPLSWEAHTQTRLGYTEVDRTFQIEEPQPLCDWLSQILGEETTLDRVNESTRDAPPNLSSEALSRVRVMFPTEAKMYGL